jgi:hypothetical protein
VSKAPWPLHSGLSKATLTLLTAPVGTFRLLCKVVADGKHTTCTGSITINGNETLEYTADGQKRLSTTNLSSIPTITTTGLDCLIIITCVDRNSLPILKETTEYINCRWDQSSKRIQIDETTWKLSSSEILTSASCEVGDTIRRDGRDYEVIQTKAFSKLSGRNFLMRAWLAG